MDQPALNPAEENLLPPPEVQQQEQVEIQHNQAEAQQQNLMGGATGTDGDTAASSEQGEPCDGRHSFESTATS